MRKLASVQRILSLEPIAGADRIEKAKILGWTLVVNKKEFKVGDLCCYCEVDSILPEKPEFEFLRERHFRIKTVKKKGIVSQGIAFPLSILPGYETCLFTEGMDVSDWLGITQYQPYIPAQLAGTVKGNFPDFLHKTDEDRIQGVPGVLERWKGFTFSISEKLDGTSFTCYLNNGVFGVCSRNLELKEDASNTYWKVARELDLERKLMGEITRLPLSVALQGELIGMGIQKNKYNLPDVQLKLFNIFNIGTGKYLDQDEFVRVAANLGLDTVPMLGEIPLDHTVDQLVELAKGPSKLNPKIPREGIVFRPEHEMYDEDLRGRLSFKVLNPIYLLEQEE